VEQPRFWIISLMIALYAVLDNFDFGAGILHLFIARTDRERRYRALLGRK
jgi:cytochrome d ubiquinol oxidase subunit II